MKQRILAMLLLLAMCLCLAACRRENPQQPDAPSQPAQSTPAQSDSRLAPYAEKLNQIAALVKEVKAVSSPDEELVGVWEAALAMEDKAPEQIGYLLKDVNGDGQEELLIGTSQSGETAYTQNEIYAVYILKNKEPHSVLQGSSRNSYALNRRGEFFYQGSSGAAYSMMGIFHFMDGTLTCEDYYFTYPQEDQPEQISVYHNHTAAWDVNCSTLLTMTVDEYWSLSETLAGETVELDFVPLAEYPKTESGLTSDTLVPAPAVLAGEWVFHSGSVEGETYTADEAGYTATFSIEKQGDAFDVHYVFQQDGFAPKTLDAGTVYLTTSLYEGCGNEEWCVELIPRRSDFDDEDEFYLTLTDGNTLLLQHFYPFDGTVGVSYQTFTRK